MATVVFENKISDKLAEMVKAGIVPEHTQRIVIDIPCDDLIRVYYQCCAEEDLVIAGLDVVLQANTVKQE